MARTSLQHSWKKFSDTRTLLISRPAPIDLRPMGASRDFIKHWCKRCAKCEDMQKDWDEALPLFLFACREVPSETTGFSLCWKAPTALSVCPGVHELVDRKATQMSPTSVTTWLQEQWQLLKDFRHNWDEIQGGLKEQTRQKSIRQVISDRGPSPCLCSSGYWKENWEVSGSLAGAIHGDWKDLSSNSYDWDAGQERDLKNGSHWGGKTLDYPQPTPDLPSLTHWAWFSRLEGPSYALKLRYIKLTKSHAFLSCLFCI